MRRRLRCQHCAGHSSYLCGRPANERCGEQPLGFLQKCQTVLEDLEPTAWSQAFTIVECQVQISQPLVSLSQWPRDLGGMVCCLKGTELFLEHVTTKLASARSAGGGMLFCRLRN